jgi:nucleotide-binding universal stress UspA family protein
LFDKILWATDGSPNAEEALLVAKALAREQGGSLIVVHVVQRYATETGLAVYPDEANVTTRLEQTVKELEGEGLDISLKIVNHVGPQPAHAIAQVAREAGADLIVTGTRGHGAIRGLLVGSVVLRLLHVAPCPVLAVPGSASPAN